MHSLKKILVILLFVALISNISACGSVAGSTDHNQTRAQEQKRTVTDMYGRNLELPNEVKKVFATSALGSMMLYSINPEKMVGVNSEIPEETKRFTTEEYNNLPILGSFNKKSNTANIEEIMKAAPDLIISMGTLDDSQASEADQIEEQTGIPVALIDGNLQKLDEIYIFLGKLLNEEEKTQELAEYTRSSFSEVLKAVGSIPDDKKARVYYAEGPNGLETEPSGSSHVEVLDFVGGINVAEVEGKGGSGLSQVTLEQVIKWNPEVIIITPDRGEEGKVYNQIMSDPLWKEMDAVKSGKVFEIPTAPYNWFDRPASINRIIGVKWLSKLLYPDLVNWDIHNEVIQFYKLFYHYELNEQEVIDILKNSLPIQ